LDPKKLSYSSLASQLCLNLWIHQSVQKVLSHWFPELADASMGLDLMMVSEVCASFEGHADIVWMLRASK